MEKYGHIFSIRGGQKGIMALDLSNFYIGDTIYLTLIMFLSFYGSSLEYYFSNSKTDYNTLDKTAYSYSFNSGSVSV